MQPLFVALVWVVVAAHFAYLVYLICGGFLALRWRRTIWLHVLAVAWAVGIVALHFWCPLTVMEQWARARAGLAPLDPAGFIDHYITGVLYPETATGYVQAAVFLAVLVSWVLYMLAGRRRAGRKGETDVGADRWRAPGADSGKNRRSWA